VYTTILVCAPEGRTWPLSASTLATQLRERAADIRVTDPRQENLGGGTYISFEFPLNGEIRHANYVEGSQLSLHDGSPSDWAETISWFLNLLPSGTPAIALVEVNPEGMATIPPGADAASVEALLDRLAAGE
jgi:hypothetical protein